MRLAHVEATTTHSNSSSRGILTHPKITSSCYEDENSRDMTFAYSFWQRGRERYFSLCTNPNGACPWSAVSRRHSFHLDFVTGWQSDTDSLIEAEMPEPMEDDGIQNRAIPYSSALLILLPLLYTHFAIVYENGILLCRRRPAKLTKM